MLLSEDKVGRSGIGPNNRGLISNYCVPSRQERKPYRSTLDCQSEGQPTLAQSNCEGKLTAGVNDIIICSCL